MPPEQSLVQGVKNHYLINIKELLEKRKHSSLRQYQKNPRPFFEERGAIFFKEAARLFDDLYSLRVRKAVALAPRGGGKTFGAAALATALFLFKDFDVGIVAGSETQALTLYSYIVEWLEMPVVEQFVSIDKLTTSYLVSLQGNRIVARTASTKSIRGLHLGRKVRGALLIIDEEAEAEENIVRAARYVVRTANPPLILRQSTYHSLTGTFADLVEDHYAQGYELYKWGSFDIAQPCPYECTKCPVSEFRDKYCKGKAKTSNGWIPVAEIMGEWKDSPREAFEVESMGLRPASAGLVIQASDIDRAVDIGMRGFPKAFDYSWFAIDWGFAGMTPLIALGMAGNKVFVRHTELYSRHGADEIIEKLKELRERYGIREVFADSSHPFENDRLRNAGFAVWGVKQEAGSTLGVVFNSFKEDGVSILSYLFEKGLIGIPARENVLLKQLRTWRRDQGGHIVKVNDHFPDGLIAGMMKLKIAGIGLGNRGAKIQSLGHRLFATGARFAGGIRRAFNR